jgi:hypothetical protein
LISPTYIVEPRNVANPSLLTWLLLLLVLDAFGAARAHVADLFTCEIGGNLPILLRRTKTPIASSTLVRSDISHKVGCKCLLRCTSIGCLLASTASSHLNSPISPTIQ